MCTAISMDAPLSLHGRTLDLEKSYNECVVVTAREFPFSFTDGTTCDRHSAFVGMAAVIKEYPLYFDGMNEDGLFMAGLNFPNFAYFEPPQGHAREVAPFELIPRVLCSCKTTDEARELFQSIRIVDRAFMPELPPTPLHWMVADGNHTLVVEAMRDGIHIYDNPVGVMANAPDFTTHMYNLSRYRHLSAWELPEKFKGATNPCSKGAGAVGLPGDFTSESRFVRAAFVRQNASFPPHRLEMVGQFFHLLEAVGQTKGCNCSQDGEACSLYLCCCDGVTGTYYYSTYENRQLCAVSFSDVSLDNAALHQFPLIQTQQVYYYR